MRAIPAAIRQASDESEAVIINLRIAAFWAADNGVAGFYRVIQYVSTKRHRYPSFPKVTAPGSGAVRLAISSSISRCVATQREHMKLAVAVPHTGQGRCLFDS
jgi:hypothetical protein